MTAWLAPALVNHLWQSTLVGAVVWLAAMALRGNRARVRYWLWTAASVKFLVPFALLAGLGERVRWPAPPVAVQAGVSAVSVAIEGVLAPADVAAAMPVSAADPSPVWPWLLAAVWSVGTVVVLASWWRQWRRVAAALAGATPVRLDAEYGAGGLTVLSSPLIPEPGVVGILRPRLLLPQGLAGRLTSAQLRALLVHERCHVRGHDNLVAVVHMAVEAIWWFHPMVWWIGRRHVEERERACDEAVLQAGIRPQDYAEGLLEVCRQSVGAPPAWVAGVGGSHLRGRVEAIMRHEMGSPMNRRRRLTLTVAVAVVIGAPVANGTLRGQSQPVTPPTGLVFQAASVRPARPFPGGPREHSIQTHMLKRAIDVTRNGDLRVSGSLHSLLQAAYGVSRFQIDGGPSWVRSDQYAIEARAAADATPEDLRAMLQALLADRFDLVLRRETRTLPVYELVAADGGLKIQAMREGECTAGRAVRWDAIDLAAPLYVCGSFRRRELSQVPETRPYPRWPRVDRIEAGAASMSSLIELVSGDVDRLVVDRTGFTAPFNLLLEFAASRSPESRLPPHSGPSIADALDDQLGLRLQPVSAQVDVLVIERAAT